MYPNNVQLKFEWWYTEDKTGSLRYLIAFQCQSNELLIFNQYTMLVWYLGSAPIKSKGCTVKYKDCVVPNFFFEA